MQSKPHKVLIIVENLPVPFDSRVWQEATTLVENGYIVSVICPKGKGYDKDIELLQGVHIYRHNLPKEGNGFPSYVREYLAALWQQFRLSRKVYKEIGFDVIQGCNPPDNIFLVALLYRSKGVKYIFDHHDICPELFLAKFGNKNLLYKSQLLLERLTYKTADMAFVTNESYKEIAITRGRMDADRVFVLRSGPDLKRLMILPPDEGLKRGRKYLVGYVGVIGQQEGIDYLLSAAAHIKHVLNRNDVGFCICGDGPYLQKAKENARKLKVEDLIEFTGRISDALLLKYLNSADVCVNPDEFNEMNNLSTMNKVLEYMALGKPIVQFDLKEGRYSAGDSSLYAKNNDPVDLAEKIILLLADKKLRESMGNYGKRRIVEELSWSTTSKELLKGYQDFFSRGSLKTLSVQSPTDG